MSRVVRVASVVAFLAASFSSSFYSSGIEAFSTPTMTSSGTVSKWRPISGLSSIQDIALKEGKVKLVETMVPQIKNAATNPNGAVSIVQYEGSVYCVSASCSSCKIPLNKAQILPPNDETTTPAEGKNKGTSDPRIACDFCKATFNLRTGERLEKSAEGGGIMGGIVKGIFAKQDKVPLPIYALGEKNDQLLINVG